MSWGAKSGPWKVAKNEAIGTTALLKESDRLWITQRLEVVSAKVGVRVGRTWRDCVIW